MAIVWVRFHVFESCVHEMIDTRHFSHVSCRRLPMMPFLNISHTLVISAVASRVSARAHTLAAVMLLSTTREPQRSPGTQTTRSSRPLSDSIQTYEASIWWPLDSIQREFNNPQETADNHTHTTHRLTHQKRAPGLVREQTCISQKG